MITLQCDNCDKPFEIEDDAAGEKVACPYCGDVNRAPAAAVAAAPLPPSGPTPKTEPRPVGKPKVADVEPERQLAVIRQAMFRAHPFWYALIVILSVGGIALAVLAQSSATFTNSRWLVWAGLGTMTVAVVWWLIWWAAPHRWVKLIVTDRRTIRQEGIVMRKTSEVMHRHVTNVTIRQGLLQRLLDVGYIGIDSAGQGGEIEGSDDAPQRRGQIEIEVPNVPHPYRIKGLIDQYR